MVYWMIAGINKVRKPKKQKQYSVRHEFFIWESDCKYDCCSEGLIVWHRDTELAVGTKCINLWEKMPRHVTESQGTSLGVERAEVAWAGARSAFLVYH